MAADLAAPGPGEVIATTGEGPFGVTIAAHGHGWKMDEPRDEGGLDAGPTPYDALLAALGACTSMTVRLIARRERIPLDDIVVRLHHDRDHARDCQHCDDSDSRVEAIFRIVTLVGALTPDQRARLMEVANRCPVHRTLTGVLHVHTSEG